MFRIVPGHLAMFLDRAKIFVKAGDGGDGCIAFRREKYVPFGGPSGGNGGAGGNIYFRSTVHLNTLLPFRFNQHFKAGNGAHGSGNDRQGKQGKDRTIDLPVGTQICDQTGDLLFDFEAPDQVQLVAHGGRGGKGNAAFATASNRAPRQRSLGDPGENLTLLLELKVLADVALIGLPNAGKSTLISALSSAKPKIADYPFTTLTPNLGVVSWTDYNSFVVADVPGLIKGAHAGQGLGDQFLRHIERCRLLVHLVDISGAQENDPIDSVHTIMQELKLYDATLLQKPQIIAASKMDAAEPEMLERLREYCVDKGLPFSQISAATGEGLSDLKQSIAKRLGAQ